MSYHSSKTVQEIFIHGRTLSHWLNEPVTDETLHEIYNLMKWGPTSANCCPIRILFLKSLEEKNKLLPCLDPGNVEKTRTAPVTAILAQDLQFYEKLPQLYPHGDAKSWFVGKKSHIETTAFRNSTLQGAYLMMAARSLGLDCGPMSGFSNDKVDATFFAGTTWKSNFLCNLGHGDHSKLYPRSPRLNFEETCKII